MEIAVIVVVFGIAALFVLFLLARRMLRLAIRLALGGALVVLLIIGGLVWWWFNSGGASEQNANRPANTRRTTSR